MKGGAGRRLRREGALERREKDMNKYKNLVSNGKEEYASRLKKAEGEVEILKSRTS